MEESRTYHWPARAEDVARALLSKLNDGHLRSEARQVGPGQIAVTIFSVEDDRGGQLRRVLSLTLIEREKTVQVTMDDLNVTGSAGDLLGAGLRAARNPLALIGRIDEIAEDIETLQTPKKVWEIIEAYVANAQEPVDESVVVCPYCRTASPRGTLACPACGASLVVT